MNGYKRPRINTRNFVAKLDSMDDDMPYFEKLRHRHHDDADGGARPQHKSKQNSTLRTKH